MYDRMGFDEIPHVYADCYECYKEFFPSKNLTQSKRYTSPIERNNGRQRHWLAAHSTGQISALIGTPNTLIAII